MKRVLLTACLGAALLSLSGQALAEVQIPHTFVNGEKADASQVNANFSALADAIDQQATAGPETIDISRYFAPHYIRSSTFDLVYSQTTYDGTGKVEEERWAEPGKAVNTYEVVSAEENKYRYQFLAYAPDGKLSWDDLGDANLDEKGIWYRYWEGSPDMNNPEAGMIRTEFDSPIVTIPGNAYINAVWANAAAGTSTNTLTSEHEGIYLYMDQRALVAIEDVEVKAGSFQDCLKISAIQPANSRMDVRWICPEVGLAKQYRVRGTSERLTELVSYERLSE